MKLCNMDGLRGYYANEICKTEKDKQCMIFVEYVEPKKYNKLMSIIKKKQIQIYSEQTSGYQWRQKGAREIKVQDSERYKL